MVETRPTKAPGVGSSFGGAIPDRGRGVVVTGLPPVDRTPARGRPGNRWPDAKELAALMVGGILRLPARYRRGMFADVLA